MTARRARPSASAPLPPCQAIVDDWDRLSYYAPRQRVSVPGNKPCSRRSTEAVQHLHLCATHARLAREGLVAESGRVANQPDIRNVHRYPEKFPNGLYSWVQNHRPREAGMSARSWRRRSSRS